MRKITKLLLTVLCVCCTAVGLIACGSKTPQHTHKAEDGWHSDATDHWQECKCGEVMNKTPHAFTELKVTAAPTKTVYTAGETFDKSGMVVKGVCECGDVETSDYTVVYQTENATALHASDTKVTLKKGELTADVNVTVNKLSVAIPAADETKFTYNGQKQTYAVAESANYTVSGNEQTDAGTYDVIVTLKDKVETAWADGTTDDLKFTFVIAKKSVVKPTADETKFTYNGQVQTYTVAESADYTVTGNKQTDAGTYKVTVTLNDKDNVEWADKTSADVELPFVIAKKSATVVWDKAESYVYDDTPLAAPTATITGVDGNAINLTVTGETLNKAGTFTFTATTDNGNYTLEGATTEVTVKLANSINGLTVANVKYGETPAPSSQAAHGNAVYTYATAKDGEYAAWNVKNGVGKYFVKAFVEGTDTYVSAVAYYEFEVVRADNAVTELAVANIKCGETPAPSAKAIDGTVTYKYSNSADGEYADLTALNAGTYYIKAYVAQTANYNAAESEAKEFKVEHVFEWKFGEESDEKKCVCGEIDETVKKTLENVQKIDLGITASGLDNEKSYDLVLTEANATVTVKSVKLGENSLSDSATLSVADFGYLYGEKILTVVVTTSDGTEHTLTVPVLLVTKVITNADDYAEWITVAKACESEANVWGGYFELGNDITVTNMVTFARPSGWNAQDENKQPIAKLGFKGTFDGCGYTIDGLVATANGFIGCFAKDGVLKNISFTNVDLRGNNLICSGGYGTIENVYVQYKSITNYGPYNGTIANMFGTVKNVFIDASNVVVDSTCQFRLLSYDGSGFNGVFAICPEGYTVTNARNSGSFATGVIEAFKSYDDLKSNEAAQAKIESWNGEEFWTVTSGIPKPANLNLSAIGLGPRDLNLDILVDNGTVKLNETAYTARYTNRVFDFGTVASVKFGDDDFDKSAVSVSDGIISIKRSAFGYNYGENKTIVITDENGQTITIAANLVSKVIKTADDYGNWIKIAKACESETYVWGGYFKLGATITATNMVTFDRPSDWNAADVNGAHGFKGTFDGCGYAIDGLVATSANGFIGCFAKGGVLKNIAFRNVKMNGGNLICSGGYGQITNVYVQYDEINNNGQYNGTIANFNGESGSVTNVFIDASAATVTDACKYHILNQAGTGFGGIFAIAPAGYTLSNARSDNGSFVSGTISAYATAEDMKADEVTQSKISGWSSTYWKIVDGVPQFIVK